MPRIHPTAEVDRSAKIGTETSVWHHSQIREDAVIGDDCIIGKNVYIDFGVTIGNKVKIQNNCSIYHKAEIHDGAFIGPHCILTNDKHPRSIAPDGKLKDVDDWKSETTTIKEGASLGAGSILLTGVTIGTFSLIGAGSVVTKDVPDYSYGYGNPFKAEGYVCKCAKKLKMGSTCKQCGISLSKKGPQRDNSEANSYIIKK